MTVLPELVGEGDDFMPVIRMGGIHEKSEMVLMVFFEVGGSPAGLAKSFLFLSLKKICSDGSQHIDGLISGIRLP